MFSSGSRRTEADRPVRGWRRLSRSGFLRNSDGIAAIEFGMLFPLFCMVVIGAIEFGRAFEARNHMSHALSRAVRVVNIDAAQTTSEIAALMAEYLDDFDEDDLTITTSSATISGVDYMDISVSFPFQVIVPFTDVTEVTLSVDTRAPLMSAIQ